MAAGRLERKQNTYTEYGLWRICEVLKKLLWLGYLSRWNFVLLAEAGGVLEKKREVVGLHDYLLSQNLYGRLYMWSVALSRDSWGAQGVHIAAAWLCGVPVSNAWAPAAVIVWRDSSLLSKSPVHAAWINMDGRKLVTYCLGVRTSVNHGLCTPLSVRRESRCISIGELYCLWYCCKTWSPQCQTAVPRFCSDIGFMCLAVKPMLLVCRTR